MKLREFVVLAITLCVGATAMADDGEKREMKIVIETQAGDGGGPFTWISDDPNLDLQSMQVGETQSIVDEAGRATLVTREADGYRFDVDGRSIHMPAMNSLEVEHHATTVDLFDGSEDNAEFDVEVLVGGEPGQAAATGGVTIITGDALDASTQESIKAVLQSVGRGDDVTFIEGSRGGPGTHVNVIRKKVEIVQ